MGKHKVKPVIVLNLRGLMLQNTTEKRANELLELRKARLIEEQPFTIQLLIPTGEAGLQNRLLKPKKRYTVKETAKLLACSTSTLYRKIKNGLVPAERREQNILISGEWLQSRINN